jgi:hypothetical protein
MEVVLAALIDDPEITFHHHLWIWLYVIGRPQLQ